MSLFLKQILKLNVTSSSTHTRHKLPKPGSLIALSYTIDKR